MGGVGILLEAIWTLSLHPLSGGPPGTMGLLGLEGGLQSSFACLLVGGRVRLPTAAGGAHSLMCFPCGRCSGEVARGLKELSNLTSAGPVTVGGR